MFSRSLARHFFPTQRPRPSLSIRPLTRSITRIPIRSLFSRRLGRRLKEGEILLLIDEAQLMFNSRKWQNISRQGWLSFFSQHRHYGYDVILVAQFDRMLDRQVRCLIEYEEVHRKVSRFGYIGFFIGLFTGDNLYVAVKRWYPIKERVEGSFFFGNKKLFDIYDSYNHFDTPGQGQRVSGDKRGPTITLPLSTAEPEGEKKEEEDSGLEFIGLEES